MSRTTQYFKTKEGENLLTEYKNVLLNNSKHKPYKSKKRHILFICGGSIDKGRNFRKLFLSYANKHLGNYYIFLAEEAFAQLENISNDVAHNLALFEDTICHVSDCIIIFPESPGSHCEIGYFAKNKEIKNKILVANSFKLHSENSFINDGPIALIEKSSRFSKIVLKDLEKGKDPDYSHIKKKLDTKLNAPQKKKTFKITSYKDMNLQDKMFLINDIIHLFNPCSILSIEEILRGVFKSFNKSDVIQCIALLNGRKFTKPSDINNDFFVPTNEPANFIEYETNFKDDFRLKIINYYEKNNLEPSSILNSNTEEL